MDLVPREYKKENSMPGISGSNFAFEDHSGSGLVRTGTKLAWAVLVIFILAWVGLYFYGRTIPKQITELKNRQVQVFGQSEREIADKILAMENGIMMLQNTLRSHVYASELLNKISELTLPQIQWKSLNLNAKEKRLKLSGLASNFTEAGKQIMVLQENFAQVEISGVQLAQTGGVNFVAEMSFDSKLLQKETFK